MKRLCVLLTLFCLSIRYTGFSQNYRWSKAFGGKDTDWSTEAKVDGFGNVYVLGMFFNDTVDFDPGPAVTNFTCTSSFGNAFLVKFDSVGNFIWARQIPCSPATSILTPRGLAIDKDNQLYISGEFDETIDADPGPGTYNLVSNGNGYDIFVLKWDSSGNLIWAHSFGGAYGSCVLGDIMVDLDKTIYLTGEFETFGAPIDFDPGPGSYFLSSASNVPFISKLDSMCNFIWVRSDSSIFSGNGYGVYLVTDKSKNIYTAGTISGVLDFDPGPASYTLNSPYALGGTFVSKLSAAGVFLWADVFTGTDLCGPGGLLIDGQNNLYVSGIFRGICDLDPGPGVASYTSNGLSDSFISKLDSAGNSLWVKTFGGPNYDECMASARDKNGNIYLTGDYGSTVDFDPGPGTYTLSTAASSILETFILKLDAAGNFMWVKDVVGADSMSYSYDASIFADSSGNVYAAGAYAYTVDLNPDYGTVSSTAVGARDAYVLKLGPCQVTMNAGTNQNICPGQSYTLSVDGPYLYTWNPGALVSPSLAVSPTVTTTYTLTASLSNQCWKEDSVAIIVSACTGFKTYASSSGEIQIFPNPSNGQFTIVIDKPVTMKVFNSTGQLIDEQLLEQNGEHLISLLSLKEGIYIIKTEMGMQKLVIDR